MLCCDFQIQLLSTRGGEQYEESGNHWDSLPSIGKISITFWLLGSVEGNLRKEFCCWSDLSTVQFLAWFLTPIRVKHHCK